LPWEKLKFLDEAHFVPKSLHKQLIIGPISKSRRLISAEPLDDSFSLVLMTSLSKAESPCIVDVNYNTNSQYDFLAFLIYCVGNGYLSVGDVLILDNASIHRGSEVHEHVLNLANQNGFMIRFLPKYSPELNPCELIWSYVKTYVRNNREYKVPILKMLIDAFAIVSHDLVIRFYSHCILTMQTPTEKRK